MRERVARAHAPCCATATRGTRGRNLGYIYWELRDTTAAAMEYRRVLLVDPTLADALYNIGRFPKRL